MMVIMVLDHTRDFAFSGTLHFNATDLTVTTPAIFFTRWITHFCVPVFVFLAGTGAYLQRARGKSLPDLSRFLVSRGLWLIVLEFTVVHLGIRFWWDTRFLGFAQVILGHRGQHDRPRSAHPSAAHAPSPRSVSR